MQYNKSNIDLDCIALYQSKAATESAALEKEASDRLNQQKLSQIFNQKFQELLQQAKINIFFRIIVL